MSGNDGLADMKNTRSANSPAGVPYSGSGKEISNKLSAIDDDKYTGSSETTMSFKFL